jgi:DNA-directed RNA polymerase omega subunit
MSVVYLEDIVKTVGNKYLAVHIAGLRARQLNKQEVPLFTPVSPRKPASEAIEELIEGKIEYSQSDSGPENLDDPFDVKEKDTPK